MIKKFEGTKVPVHNIQGKAVLTTKDIANALGVSSNAIANTYRRYRDEFDEEDSFLSQIVTGKKSRNMRVFTKSGIVQLCFFVKSPKASAFRRWAKKTLTKIMDGSYEVRDTSGSKIEVIADLMYEIAQANHKEGAERIKELFGEELPPSPSREDFVKAIEKEGYDFGKNWLLTLRTLPPGKRKILIAPGVGPETKRKKK